jgi:hypothetical protein
MVELTIGMAVYNDFDGVYFTLQALRLYQDLDDTELLVVDNYGCEDTRGFVEGWAKGRYIRATDAVGTAAPCLLLPTFAVADKRIQCVSRHRWCRLYRVPARHPIDQTGPSGSRLR